MVERSNPEGVIHNLKTPFFFKKKNQRNQSLETR